MAGWQSRDVRVLNVKHVVMQQKLHQSDRLDAYYLGLHIMENKRGTTRQMGMCSRRYVSVQRSITADMPPPNDKYVQI